MTDVTTWRLLLVDDDPEICTPVREFLEGEELTRHGERLAVDTQTDFGCALHQIEARRYDLLILDVRLGPHDEIQRDEAGVQVLRDIQRRCFLPVVFYTALAHRVRTLESPLIRVVEKTEGLPRLLEAVVGVLATGLPVVNRALIRHLESVQRDYMWEFVASNWDMLQHASDRVSVAYLLARRLGMSLSGPGILQLVTELGGAPVAAPAQGRVHPMEYYIIPPITAAPLTGDVYRSRGDSVGYRVLLTPSCDLAHHRAEHMHFARCLELSDQQEYRDWRATASPSHRRTDDLKALLRNHRKRQPERYHFLPGVLAIPDLIVDFQQVICCSPEEMDRLERIASLDSPFAEELLARYVRYAGRLGTPDLDVDTVMRRLQPAQTGDAD
jgi:CheY-like chemotaxis protein